MRTTTRIYACGMLLLLSVLSAPSGYAQVAPPAEEGIAYVVTFIDVSPQAVNAVRDALRTYRNAGRQAPKNVDLHVYQEIGQRNRFMVTEAWAEEADYTAHSEGTNAAQLRETLADVQLSPPDVRMHRAFSIGAPGSTPDEDTPTTAIYVQTHLDVAPPLFAALEPLLATFVDASRSENGALQFDILQHVAPRQNHLTLLEAWHSEAALDSHRLAPHTRTFRSDSLPILGSLYDERLYRLVD